MIKDCILVSKDMQEIKCKYYEVEEKCIEIIKHAIQKNPKIGDEFEEFSKNYTYFNPYFDFVLAKLDYVLINPFDLENAYLSVTENDYIIVHQENCELELFPLSDDKHIGLYDVTPEKLELSMIDENLKGLKLKGYGHLFTSRLILHNYFIKDKDLYQKYIKRRNIFSFNGFYFFDYTTFLLYYKSFLRLEKAEKNERNQTLSIFKNCDIYYLLEACQENISEKQKEWIIQMVEAGILPNENIYLTSKDRMENRVK